MTLFDPWTRAYSPSQRICTQTLHYWCDALSDYGKGQGATEREVGCWGTWRKPGCWREHTNSSCVCLFCVTSAAANRQRQWTAAANVSVRVLACVLACGGLQSWVVFRGWSNIVKLHRFKSNLQKFKSVLCHCKVCAWVTCFGKFSFWTVHDVTNPLVVLPLTAHEWICKHCLSFYMYPAVKWLWLLKVLLNEICTWKHLVKLTCSLHWCVAAVRCWRVLMIKSLHLAVNSLRVDTAHAQSMFNVCCHSNVRHPASGDGTLLHLSGSDQRNEVVPVKININCAMYYTRL